MRSVFIHTILLAGLALAAGPAIAQDSQIKGVPQDISNGPRYTDQRGYAVRHSEQRNRPAPRQAERPAAQEADPVIRGSQGPRIEKVTPEQAKQAAREAAQNSTRKAERPLHRETSRHHPRTVAKHDPRTVAKHADRRGRAAFGSVGRGEGSPVEVHYNDGTLVGQDPDTNVRLMILKNNSRTLWSR